MDNIIEVKSLYKSYGSIEAVRGIDLEIRKGECFGFLGPNGAGKTTSIEMMEGILAPDRGDILFKEKKIDREFKKKIGIQFQNTSLPEYITVKETIELFSSFYPEPRPMDELIRLCSLEDILNQDNRRLSGGQRQRMLLALAIIPKPELVFLDEPTTGLDPQARRNFWSLIEKIKSENSTVLLTTHYMDEAEKLCDRIAVIDNGEILDCDTPDNLLNKHFKGVLIQIPLSGEKDCMREKSPERELLFKSKFPQARTSGNNIEIQTENLHKSLEDLVKIQCDLTGMAIHKPNLEDLFIKLTGSSLRT